MTLDMGSLTVMRTQRVKCAPGGKQLVVTLHIYFKVMVPVSQYVPNEVTQYCTGYIGTDRDITEN